MDFDDLEGNNMQIISDKNQKQDEDEGFDLDDLDDDNLFTKPAQNQEEEKN